MATTLAVNPRKRRRRRRRAAPRRAPRRRRRRSNPNTLRIANPRGIGGIQNLLMPALMVAVGGVASRALPGLLKLPVNTRNQKAFAAIGTGIAMSLIGANFLGRKNAESLALGAIAAGVGLFVDQFLPANLKGLGQEVITEAEVDDEIRALTDGVEGLGLGPFGMDVSTGPGIVGDVGQEESEELPEGFMQETVVAPLSPSTFSGWG